MYCIISCHSKTVNIFLCLFVFVYGSYFVLCECGMKLWNSLCYVSLCCWSYYWFIIFSMVNCLLFTLLQLITWNHLDQECLIWLPWYFVQIFITPGILLWWFLSFKEPVVGFIGIYPWGCILTSRESGSEPVFGLSILGYCRNTVVQHSRL